MHINVVTVTNSPGVTIHPLRVHLHAHRLGRFGIAFRKLDLHPPQPNVELDVPSVIGVGDVRIAPAVRVAIVPYNPPQHEGVPPRSWAVGGLR